MDLTRLQSQPTRLLPPKRLSTPRLAARISPNDRGLLPGAPALTRTGLPPAGLIQLARRRRLIASLALCATLLTGCGGSSDDDQARTATAPSKLAPEPRNPLELPKGIPLTAAGPADAADAKVVRAWSDALRAGDVAAATALWAVPSKVQNGTPVLRLASRAHVRFFNASLPCGSVVTATGGAPRDFTIATFRLTERKGGACDAAAGATARSAIRVRDGKIVEWYRLPDDPDGPEAPGAQPDDIEATTI